MADISKNLFFQTFGDVETEPKTEQFGTITERTAILALCRVFKPSVFLEIGVNTGITANYLLRNCGYIEKYIGVDVEKNFKPELKLQEGEIPEKAGKLVKDDRFELILTKKGSKELKVSQIGQVDMALIDGSHAYKDVKKDTELAKKLVKNGVILWHDYGVKGTGVARVVDEINNSSGNHIVLIGGTCLCFEVISNV